LGIKRKIEISPKVGETRTRRREKTFSHKYPNHNSNQKNRPLQALARRSFDRRKNAERCRDDDLRKLQKRVRLIRRRTPKKILKKC